MKSISMKFSKAGLLTQYFTQWNRRRFHPSKLEESLRGRQGRLDRWRSM